MSLHRSLYRLLPASLAFLLVLSGCGGGSSSSSSNPSQPASPVVTPNPTPAITSITPASLVAGSASQSVTVTGTGFIAATVINLNGTPLATTYGSATSVTAVVPGSAIAADGTIKFTATNPGPGGGSSAAQSYSVTVPVAAVTSLSPQVVPQNVAAVITISGSGFEANSVAQWNGVARPTTFVNATTLQVALTAADLQSFGAGDISIANPGLAATTPLELAIAATTPTISWVSPGSVAAFTGSNVPVQVIISGSGFALDATVQANGALVPILSQTMSTIIATLPVGDFAAPGSVSIVVTNPGSPAVSSNSIAISVTGPTAPTLSLSPNSAPAGSPDTTITLFGTGFYPDSSVEWNNVPLSTTYASANQLTAVIPATLLSGFAQANISVNTPEDQQQPPSQPFTTYLALPVNDIVYNSVDGLIYASIPGSAGEDLGNTIAAIDPATGVVQKTIFVGSEPNRLALSTDGTQLFVGLNGAGAVRQVNLTNDTAGNPFSLGGGSGVYNPPFNAISLAAVPGEPNSVAVYASNGVVTVYDSGVARAKTSSGLQTYFDSNVGAIAFGSSASTLYVMSNAIGGYLYQLTVDTTGVTASAQIGTGTGGSTLQYDNGRLYVPTGVVFSATTGSQLGQFSTVNSTSTPAAAAGPIVSDSTLNRAWIVSNNFGSSTGQVLSFNSTTFDPVASIPVTGIGAIAVSVSTGPADLIRWGQDGVAFHTANQLYVLQGPIVKDTSSSPADLAVAVNAAATATTGSTFTWTFTVANTGPNPAQGITLTSYLPESIIFGSVQPSQGSCSGQGVLYCDLGSLASGSSATVTVTGTPSVAGTLEATATVSSVSYDPISTNNQASASTTVTGSAYNPSPVISQLSPSEIQAGSSTFVLTVNGTGFTANSTVLWNGQQLPTTLIGTGQLTATVDSSLIANLGWAPITVSTPSPGGGQSSVMPFTIYQLLNVPANAISFDPFTRKLYAVLPSTATNYTGNSIVAIDPSTGAIGTPVNVGSEPNLLSETSDGNYFYIGLSGAKSLARFNLLTQSLDTTIPLPANSGVSGSNGPAMAIAAVPGSDTSLAVEIDSFDGIGILDISGTTATFRSKFGFGYSGDYPVFADATHFYAFDASTTGAEFYRYSVDANGAEEIDGTTLDGMGGFGGRIALDGSLVYGSGGGIINPSTTPPSQVAVLALGSGPSGSTLTGGGVVPYATEAKSFNIGVNTSGTAATYLQRFDTRHFTLEQEIPLPTASIASLEGTRWGQDGLAFILPGSTLPSPATPAQVFLIRGPFVLPAEAADNPAPSLTGTSSGTLTAGSGNTTITVTGSGFLPGATVFWNNSPRTTTYVDNGHLSVAIPASDVSETATIVLTSQNPGSATSNTITLSVQ